MNRREFLRRFVVSSVLIATASSGVVELASLVGKSSNQGSSLLQTIQQQATSSVNSGIDSSAAATSQASITSAVAPSGYVLISSISQLSSKTYAYFNHPNYGYSILISVGGQWKAFSATCTHRLCTVQYQGSEIFCPCHGGTFNPSNGNVTGGPPPSPLPEFGVKVLNNNVYVSTVRVN